MHPHAGGHPRVRVVLPTGIRFPLRTDPKAAPDARETAAKALARPLEI
jgi:hypothetical protein